jgi:hypothetical protein
MATCIWWNVQRLFRPGGDSPIARDLDATETYGWNSAAYDAKIEIIGSVLRQIAGGNEPAIVGFAEVEDSKVVSDIVSATGWKKMKEAIEPNDNLDGYDLSLIYSTALFRESEEARSHSVHSRFASRDIFEVSLETRTGYPLKVLLNHWPSRRLFYSDILRIGWLTMPTGWLTPS